MDKTLDELKQEANELGVQYSKNIGAAKLAEKIEAFYESQETSSIGVPDKVEDEAEVTAKKPNGKLTLGQMIAAAKVKANKTQVISIVDNDNRVNNVTTTVTVNCSNEHFDLGTLTLPLNMAVEVKQGHIDVLKGIEIPMHTRGKDGLSTVQMRKRYSLSSGSL